MTRIATAAVALPAPQTQAQEIIGRLSELGTDFRLVLDEDDALLEAHVSSGVAARMLKPLGRLAVGQFHALPGNMVVIDAVVSPEVARRMLAAARRVG